MVGFNVGDKVFGKVKGYPAWPARVTSVKGNSYGVEFYGTNETAVLKNAAIYYYLSNKHKFPMQKRKFYVEAVTDIELEIQRCGGSDGNPNPNAEEETKQEPQTKGNKRKRNYGVKKASETSTSAPINKRIKLEDQNHNLDDSHNQEEIQQQESQSENTLDTLIQDDTNTLTSQEETKAIINTNTETIETNDYNSDEMDIEKNVLETKIEVNRQREKINEIAEIVTLEKTKDKITEDELIEENPYYTGEINVKDVNLLPDFYLTAISLYAERVQDNSHYYKISKPDAISLDDVQDTKLKVLPVKINSNKYCGLIYAPKPLDTYRSEFDRAMDDARIVQELLELKAEVDVGNFALTDHRLIKNLDCADEYVHNATNSSLVAYKKSKLQCLQREMEVFKLLVDLKKCLGLKEAKTSEAISYMNQLLDSTIEVISLKKRPFFIDAIVRLGRYVGNRKDWTLDEEELVKFEENAVKIRETADEILKNIRAKFSYGESADDFLENFEKDCEVFNDATKNMSEAEVFSLCAEPLSRKAQLELIFDEQATNNDNEDNKNANDDADALYTPE